MSNSVDYQKAIRIVRNVRSGVITSDILAIAEAYPEVLIEASSPEMRSMVGDDAIDAYFTAVVVMVLELVRGGRKIDAIKTYRAATGCGLKEAKDTVDKIESQI